MLAREPGRRCADVACRVAAEQRPQAGERAADVAGSRSRARYRVDVVEEISDLLARAGAARSPARRPAYRSCRPAPDRARGSRRGRGRRRCAGPAGHSRRGRTNDRGPGAPPGWASAGARRRAGIVEPADRVDEHAGRVDDRRAPRSSNSSPVSSSRAATPAIRPPRAGETRHRRVVERGAAQVGEGPRQADRQPGVVELAVGVDDPPAQPVGRRSSGSARRPGAARSAATPPRLDRPARTS